MLTRRLTGREAMSAAMCFIYIYWVTNNSPGCVSHVCHLHFCDLPNYVLKLSDNLLGLYVLYRPSTEPCTDFMGTSILMNILLKAQVLMQVMAAPLDLASPPKSIQWAAIWDPSAVILMSLQPHRAPFDQLKILG